MAFVFGPQHDLTRLIGTHLFIIGPNNSGTTFLQRALATSQHTWNLNREGQHTFGFSGPSSRALKVGLLWSTRPEWVQAFRDESNFNWAKSLSTWYFQAAALRSDATVFVEKSPPFMLCVDQLLRNFVNPKFLFLVRNPYAVAESIARRESKRPHRGFPGSREELLTLAAQHITNCFQFQQENLQRYADYGTTFTYEEMCEEPEKIEHQIATLVPEIDDLKLNQSLAVKGLYHEPLRNMNQQQIDRLSTKDLAILNRIFATKKDLLSHFGYDLLE